MGYFFTNFVCLFLNANAMKNFLRRLLALVDVWDHVDYHTADNSIRNNIEFRGPNAIILACAIVIASVGLNVNSIPVIIGAMLISPVMGPILGMGLGLGTEDNRLLVDSLKNFAVMVVISIMASTLFFLLSPLTLENQSELLARTKPTIYDVLIALFGGFAGILETSRKKQGTVIAGVAIATALMPPLCTVGYGISRLSLVYIGGALYLFIINTIFIAMATFFAVKLFRFPTVVLADEKHQRIKKGWYFVIIIIIVVPSIITAVSVVKENNFKINAATLVRNNKNMGKSFVYDHKTVYNRKSPVIELYVAGESLSDEAKEALYREANSFGFTRAQIIIHEDATVVRNDIDETEIVKGIYEHADKQIKMLNDSIAKLNVRLNMFAKKELPSFAIARELFAQHPEITSLTLTRGSAVDAETAEETEHIVALISSDGKISDELRNQIERWLKVRIGNENVTVVY